MRKWVLLLLCAALTVTGGCSARHTAEPPAVTGIACDFTATYQDLSLAGSLERAAAGMLTVSLREPAALNGLTLTWDGEGARVSLGMLHYTMDSETPAAGFGRLLLDALDAVFCQSADSVLTDVGASLSGKVGQYGYTLVSEPETGTLLSLEVPNAALSVKFSQVRALSPP